MTVAPVCRVGDTLNLTCTASVEFIEWSFSLVNEQRALEKITAFSNSIDASQQVTRRTVNSTTFIFMRTSAQGAAPLISTLSIDSVSIGLNGIVVHCMEVKGSMISASATIHIIVDVSNSKLANHRCHNADIYYEKILDLYIPTLSIVLEEYGADNVSVTVEWAQLEGAVYNVRAMQN